MHGQTYQPAPLLWLVYEMSVYEMYEIFFVSKNI